MMLQPYKTSVCILLDHFRVPVIPVFIRGTCEAMPRGTTLIRPGKITIVFGKPLDIEKLEQQGEDGQGDRITRTLHDRVAELGGRS